jgi:hypothetical protein
VVPLQRELPARPPVFFYFSKKNGQKAGHLLCGRFEITGRKKCSRWWKITRPPQNFSQTWGEPSYFSRMGEPSHDAFCWSTYRWGADAQPIPADAPPITAGADDDKASDEDSLSSEVSRHDGDRALTSRHCCVLLIVLLTLTKELTATETTQEQKQQRRQQRSNDATAATTTTAATAATTTTTTQQQQRQIQQQTTL